MGFIDSFLNLFRSSGSMQDVNHIICRIRCDSCGEIVDVRIIPKYDMQSDYDNFQGGLELNKEVQGKKCPNKMIIRARYDGRRLVDVAVDGGALVREDKT